MSPQPSSLFLLAAIWLAILLLAGTVLVTLAFAVRNLSYGRVKPVSAVILGGSVLLFGLLGLTGGGWIRAGILTLLALLALVMLVLVAFGARHLAER